MIEWAILCKDFDDMHETFNDILGVIPKKNCRVVPSTPTKYVLEVLPGKGTDAGIKMYIMTKTYFNRIFKYGFHGKFMSSMAIRKRLSNISTK